METKKANKKRYGSFRAFYPYYLREHSRPVTRALHYAGTALVIAISVTVIFVPEWWMLLLVPAAGYGFAWAGHFFFEKNKPATFSYPLYSLGSDFVMFFHFITGQLKRELEKARN